MKRYALLIFLALLLLTNRASAVWNAQVAAACQAIANGDATPQQQRLAWLNNRDINLQALAGNPDVSKNIFDAVQSDYIDLSNQYINELNTRRPDTAGIQTQTPTKEPQPGTDTDLTSTKANTPADMRDLHNELNNIIDEDMQKNGPPGYKPGEVDHLKSNDIDIMGDVNNPNITPENFNAMNDHTHGSVYNDYHAASFEGASRDPNAPPPNISGSGNYVNEMLRQIEDKQQALNAYSKALAEAAKHPDARVPGTAANIEYNRLKGVVHQCNAQIAKYVERISGVKGASAQIANGYNLPPPKNPALPATGADRTPGNYNAAAGTSALSDNLVKNGILDYSELLATLAEKDPTKAAEAALAIAKGADNLSDAAKGQLIAQMEQKFGPDFTQKVVAEMKNPDKWAPPPSGSGGGGSGTGGSGKGGSGSTKGTTSQPGTTKIGSRSKPTSIKKTPGSTKSSGSVKTSGSYGTASPIRTGGTRGTSFRLTDTNPGKFGAGINMVGNVITVIDVVKTGQTMWNQAVEDQYGDALITGGTFAGGMYVGLKIGGLAMTYLPTATLVAGAGMTAYDATTRIMNYVTIDGKNLNEHVQDKIEDNLYVSSQYDTEAKADMQDLFKYAIKSGAYVLPPGVTVAEGWQAVVKNMDEGRTKIFDGILVRPEPLVVEAKEPSKDDKKQAAWEQAVIEGKLNPYQYEEFLKHYDPKTGRYTGPSIADQPVPEPEAPEPETMESSEEEFIPVYDDETGEVVDRVPADLRDMYERYSGVDDRDWDDDDDVGSAEPQFDGRPNWDPEAEGAFDHVEGYAPPKEKAGSPIVLMEYGEDSITYFWSDENGSEEQRQEFYKRMTNMHRGVNVQVVHKNSERTQHTPGHHEEEEQQEPPEVASSDAGDESRSVTPTELDAPSAEPDRVYLYDDSPDEPEVILAPEAPEEHYTPKADRRPSRPAETSRPADAGHPEDISRPDDSSQPVDTPPPEDPKPAPSYEDLLNQALGHTDAGKEQPPAASKPSPSYDDLVNQALAEKDSDTHSDTPSKTSKPSTGKNDVFADLLNTAVADLQRPTAKPTPRPVATRRPRKPAAAASPDFTSLITQAMDDQRAAGTKPGQTRPAATSGGSTLSYEEQIAAALSGGTGRSSPATAPIRTGHKATSYEEQVNAALNNQPVKLAGTTTKNDYAARVAAALNTPSSTRHAKPSPTRLPYRKTPASRKPSTKSPAATYAGTYKGTSVTKLTFHKMSQAMSGIPRTTRDSITVTVTRDGKIIFSSGQKQPVPIQLDQNGRFSFRVNNAQAAVTGSGRITRGGKMSGTAVSKDHQGYCTANITFNAQKQ